MIFQTNEVYYANLHKLAVLQINYIFLLIFNTNRFRYFYFEFQLQQP